MGPRDFSRFVTLLAKSEMKVDPDRVKRQLETGYNVIGLPDTRSQYRADFIVQREKIQRRKGSLLGLPAYYQSPESLILAKLRMIKATIPLERSAKDKNDIAGILANTRVNRRRIEQAARRENTLKLFTDIQARMQAKQPRARTLS